MIYVIKKDGTKEEFNSKKIVAAVNKSAARILYTFSEEEQDFICKFAEEHAASLGKNEIQINEQYLENDGRHNLQLYGIAFYKKRCKVVLEKHCLGPE